MLPTNGYTPTHVGALDHAVDLDEPVDRVLGLLLIPARRFFGSILANAHGLTAWSVVRKEIDVTSGQRQLFSKDKYFFYIANETADEVPVREFITAVNRRCDQENTISV